MCFVLVNNSVAIKNQLDTHPYEYAKNRTEITVIGSVVIDTDVYRRDIAVYE